MKKRQFKKKSSRESSSYDNAEKYLSNLWEKDNPSFDLALSSSLEFPTEYLYDPVEEKGYGPMKDMTRKKYERLQYDPECSFSKW